MYQPHRQVGHLSITTFTLALGPGLGPGSTLKALSGNSLRVYGMANSSMLTPEQHQKSVMLTPVQSSLELNCDS